MTNLFQTIKDAEYTHTASDIDFAFYAEDQKLFMLFQETRGQNDWHINFDFPAKMYKNMIIHRGYAKAFKAEKELLWNALKSKMEEGNFTEIIFAGWSKGATEAILMAEEYYFQTKKKAFCFTFGGPKVCYTLGTKRYLDRNIYLTEYVQPNDFVTKIIPFCFRINKKVIGEKFNIKKIFNTVYYHCNYDQYIDDFYF